MLEDKILKFDLQLFAEEDFEEKLEDDEEIDNKDDDDEEEVEFEDDDDSEDEEDSKNDDDEEVEDEDLDDDPKKKTEKKIDKKEAAIIKYKRETKEAQKKIDDLQKQLDEKDDLSKIKDKKDKLVKDGLSEDEAENVAKLEIENNKLKKLVLDRQFKDLESEYPGITAHQKEIMEMLSKYEGLQPQEIFLAKFADRNVYENSTKLEQQLLHQQTINKEKSGAGGGDIKTPKTTKITKAEKRQYLEAKKLNDKLTLKRFLELNGDADEIPEEF